jgi:diguanylate cyclase (GGDEF)-like protein
MTQQDKERQSGVPSPDKELMEALAQLPGNFDVVRVVDPVAAVDTTGSCGATCHEVWGKSQRCEDCISVRALRIGQLQSKVEYMDDHTPYYVTAIPVTVGGEQKSLELVEKIEGTSRGAFKDLSDTSTESIAVIEPMTGLYNRLYIMDMIYLAIRENNPDFGMILMDIDGFKQINDHFGHIVGDHVIMAVADCLQKRAKTKKAAACRYGGDEFCLLYCSTTAEDLAEEIRGIAEDLAALPTQEIGGRVISVSAGTQCGTAGFEEPEAFIAAADGRMYENKRSKQQQGKKVRRIHEKRRDR